MLSCHCLCRLAIPVRRAIAIASASVYFFIFILLISLNKHDAYSLQTNLMTNSPRRRLQLPYVHLPVCLYQILFRHDSCLFTMVHMACVLDLGWCPLQVDQLFYTPYRATWSGFAAAHVGPVGCDTCHHTICQVSPPALGHWRYINAIKDIIFLSLVTRSFPWNMLASLVFPLLLFA